MATFRNFSIPGPTMAFVRFGAHMGVNGGITAIELGLSSEPIRVQITNNHSDVVPDDFGKAPAEVSWQMAVADVYMTLVHFDDAALRFCLSESAGGGGDALDPPNANATSDVDPYSFQMPGGTLLGNGLPRLASGCHFIGLNLQGVFSGTVPYRFPTSYLAEQPAVIPLGAEYSAVQLHWRAVPYQPVWQPVHTGDADRTAVYEVVNEATNNGPAWTRKNLTLPPATVNVFDVAGFVVGQVEVTEEFELVREILASGTILYDRRIDS